MNVRWSDSAVDDLSSICDYTEQRFDTAQARAVAWAIYDRADLLRANPFLGRAGRKPRTRELPVAGLPFLLIYRVNNDAVEILRILHGSQQWP